MTSIYRTAYPRFASIKKIKSHELASFYTLTNDEITFIKKKARTNKLKLSLAVQLKVFQRLGYFPSLNDIPEVIVKHVNSTIISEHSNAAIIYDNNSTLYRHRKYIRQYLKIKKWLATESENRSISGRRHAINIAYKSSQILNNPADIINVVIDGLRKINIELPTFSKIDRMVKHVRHLANKNIFETVLQKLDKTQVAIYDKLLSLPENYNRTGFNALKQPPHRPTISHFRELLSYHDWLIKLGSVESILDGIAKQKIEQFAEEAKSADANILKKMAEHKRYTLIACLINQAQRKAKDALIITFSKTIFKMHKDAERKLKQIQDSGRSKTYDLLNIFSEVLILCKEHQSNSNLTTMLFDKLDHHGGVDSLYENCEQAAAQNSNNYLQLLLPLYKNKRATLLRLLNSLDINSTTQNDKLMIAVKLLLEHQNKKSEFLAINVDLSFATENWKKLVLKKEGDSIFVSRRYYEICVFTYIANELRSCDLFVDGAESYSDYRKDLLSWAECQKLLDEYCKEVEISNESNIFVAELKSEFKKTAERIDKMYPNLKHLGIDEKGEPTLKKRSPKQKTPGAIQLELEIKKRLRERNLVDLLCNTHHYCNWASEFGPISGFDAKLKNPIERYILTTFAYGTCMGPTQAARHIKADITPHMLTLANRRHVNSEMLDRARTKLINTCNLYSIINAWGDGKSCAADGNLRELREENLISEFHVRYNRRGGIAYNHVANNYIALFSTFMPCGVWEAIAIIEALLKNDSDVQPDTIHADTQGQSTVVFALSHMLGIKLMPRIRNWKDLKFYRPEKSDKYKNIDSLFSKDAIDWDIIETHWQDLIQVVLSIKKGKISSSLLLRKLGNYSKKNRLYKAFQELGRVIRTKFMLEYISDVKLREVITDTTNKVEAYNGLSEWASFGSTDLVASNDADEMEKAIKYNDIVTNSIILQNIIDMSEIIYQLQREGHTVNKEDIAFLSPYITAHIKRFGDYMIDLKAIPALIEECKNLLFT